MEHYLTKKARPSLFLRLLEWAAVVCLGVWCAACVYVLYSRWVEGLDWADVVAFLLVGGVPAAVIVWIVRLWRKRRNAAAVAEALSWETETTVSWESLVSHVDFQDVRERVMRLRAGGYRRYVHRPWYRGRRQAPRPRWAYTAR